MQIGKTLLEQHGFAVVFGKHVRDRYGYLAGEDTARADDFNQIWADEQVKAILCWGTVWGAARLLPYIDFDVIRAHPKLFVGSGSVTSLHLAIAKQVDLITLYGADFGAFYRSQYTLDAFLRALTSTEAPGSVGQPPEPGVAGVNTPPLITYLPGSASGRLVGGNLAAVAGSLGTPYEIETEGRILFLEARDLLTYTTERHLTALWLAGKLQAAAGIVVGECVNCVPKRSETNTFSLEEVLQNRLSLLSVPSLYGLRIGQGKDTMPVPLGAQVRLNTEKQSLEVLEAALEG
jgi:muramoyltetrapeptide carboxypeptidase